MRYQTILTFKVGRLEEGDHPDGDLRYQIFLTPGPLAFGHRGGGHQGSLEWGRKCALDRFLDFKTVGGTVLVS